MEPEEFVRQVVFEIRKGSLLAIEKQDEIQVGFVLRKMGDISRRALLRKIGLSKSQIMEIESELLVEAEVKIKLAQAAGAGQQQHQGHGKK
jgi:DNA-binding XRE family transcriptional regulator